MSLIDKPPLPLHVGDVICERPLTNKNIASLYTNLYITSLCVIASDTSLEQKNFALENTLEVVRKNTVICNICSMA